MKKQTKTRLLALLLLLAMVLGLIPAALATDTESPGSVPESSLETQESTGGTEPDTSQTPEPSPTVSPEPDTAVDVSPSPSPSLEPSVSPTPSSTPETNTGPVIETGGTSQGTDNDTPDAEDADEIPPLPFRRICSHRLPRGAAAPPCPAVQCCIRMEEAAVV